MGKIVDGRDQYTPSVVVKQGREWRSQTLYESFVSDGKYGSRLTPFNRRPVRRIR